MKDDKKDNKQKDPKNINPLNQDLDEKNIDDKNMYPFLQSKMKEMETEFDTVEHIVIDIGTATTKIGFSGEDQPRVYNYYK
jgi:hypothetical protein